MAALPKVRLVGDRGGSVSLRVGDGVDLGRTMLLDIDAGRVSSLAIGAGSMFESAVHVQLFGGAVMLADGCEVREGVLLKVSDRHAKLQLGERTKLGRFTSLHCHESVTVEALVVLAERVTLVDSFHDVDGSDTWTQDQPLGTGPISVGRNTMVFSGAVILHGTSLGPNTVVAANALVPSGEHQAGVVLVGNPAKPVKRING